MAVANEAPCSRLGYGRTCIFFVISFRFGERLFFISMYRIQFCSSFERSLSQQFHFFAEKGLKLEYPNPLMGNKKWLIDDKRSVKCVWVCDSHNGLSRVVAKSKIWCETLRATSRYFFFLCGSCTSRMMLSLGFSNGKLKGRELAGIFKSGIAYSALLIRWKILPLLFRRLWGYAVTWWCSVKAWG